MSNKDNDNKKHLKLALIDNNGNIKYYYFEDDMESIHYDLIKKGLAKDFSKNKRLVDKVKKRGNTPFELYKLLREYKFIAVLDTTNYYNYKEGDAHSLTVVLPEDVDKLSSSQSISFLRMSKKYLSTYNISDKDGGMTEVGYFDKKGKSFILGTLEAVINKMLDKKEVKKAKK